MYCLMRENELIYTIPLETTAKINSLLNYNYPKIKIYIHFKTKLVSRTFWLFFPTKILNLPVSALKVISEL